MIKKLRLKIIIIVMVIVTVMMAVIMSMIFSFTRQNLQQVSIQILLQAAEKKPRKGFGDDGWAGRNDLCFTLERDINGKILVFGGESYDLTDPEKLEQILSAAEDMGTEVGELEQYALRFLRSSGPMGKRFVFTDISTELRTLQTLVWTCGVIGIFSFVIFLAVSILLARWLTKPVAQSMQNQRQFVADASHELKTPLTVILTNTELLQQPEYAPEERERFADNILSTAKQMRSLVESLLELARVDNGQVKASVTLLDYSRLVENAVLPFEPMYFEKGLVLESRIAEGIHLSGNERYLRQVVGILLDNGLKYATPGGTVELQLRQMGRSHCQLSVASPGAELSPQELQDIFKRFYQVDKVRNMDRSYGLGLSIAQQIVSEHGGRIWAESKDGINTFFVVLNCC